MSAERRKRILVVDKDSSFAIYFCMLLKRMGFDTFRAQSGKEALGMLGSADPDLICLDRGLSPIDGTSVLTAMRLNSLAASKNLVLMVDSEQAKEVSKAEANLTCNILPKPVTVEALHDMLQSCIFKAMGFVRKNIRVVYTETVNIRVRGNMLSVKAESLSEGGIFLLMKDPQPVGSTMEVLLPVGGASELALQGRVIYTQSPDLKGRSALMGVGVEFVGLSPGDSLAVKNFVRQYLTRGIQGRI